MRVINLEMHLMEILLLATAWIYIRTKATKKNDYEG